MRKTKKSFRRPPSLFAFIPYIAAACGDAVAHNILDSAA
jgi:hypothetical protein